MVFFQILAVLAMETDDQYTQIIRQWIMFDEAAHVASARILVKYMGLQIDRATLDLAIRTLEWMLGDLPTSEIERYKKIANQVLTKGVTDLAATNSTVTVQDFFTQVDNRDILYAS
jgi:hypothetical protein